MAIDASIYNNVKPVDLFGNFARGLDDGKRDAADQKQRDISNAYVTKQNPDGSTGIDQEATLKNLANIKGAGQDVIKAQQGFQQQSEAAIQSKIKQHNDIAGLLLPVKDQASYDKALSDAESVYGIPVSKMNIPKQYSADFVKSTAMQSLTAKDQLEKQLKEREVVSGERNADAKSSEAATAIKRQSDSHADTLLKIRTAKENKISSQDDKDAAALDKHLSSGWVGRSGQAGAVQGKINAGEAAQQLLEQGKTQPGGLDARQVEELAQSTARMLGGGAAASARVDALVPHTLWGKAQTVKEWLKNEPQGAGLQTFTDRMAETVQREKALAQTQQRQYQVEGLPAHSGFAKRNPDLYNKILQGKGIDPSMIDSNGRYKAPSSSGGPSVDADLTKMNPQQLKEYISTHGSGG